MDAGVVTDVQLQAALAEQKRWGGKLGRTLVEMGFVDEESMSLALSRQLQLPRVDLDALELPADITGFLRVDIAERYGVFPIAGDRRLKQLTVASSDPTNVEAMQELAFYTGMRIQMAVASGSGIDRAIRRYYYGESTTPTQTTTPHQLGGTKGEDRGEVAALRARVAELERLLSGQVRAMRSLVELLVDKDVIRRDEFVARARKGDPSA